MKFLVEAERRVALLRFECSQQRPDLVTVGRISFVN